MKTQLVSDQSRALSLAAATNRLRSDIARLSDELASGKVADVAKELNGSTGQLLHYETQIRLLDQFNRSASEAAAQMSATQAVLTDLHGKGSEIGIRLSSAQIEATTVGLYALAETASASFDAAIARLNTEVSGVYVLAGLNTDRPPVAGAEEILNALQAGVAGMTNADQIAAFVSDWFDAPAGGGGYVDIAYRGTFGQRRYAEIGQGERVAISTDADAPAIREMLKGLATAALVSRGALQSDTGEQRKLLIHGGTVLTMNDPGLGGESARLGLAEERVERGQAANSARLSIFMTARSEIVSADPYETATALTETQSRLDAVFAITARLSNLTLVNYLK